MSRIFYKLSSRLTFPAALVFLSISIFLFFFVTNNHKENLQKEYANKFSAINDLALKESIIVLLGEKQNQRAKKTIYLHDSLAVLKNNPGILYFVLENDSGQIIDSLNFRQAKKLNYGTSNNSKLVFTGSSYFKKSSSILYKDEVLGDLYIGFSLAEMKRNNNEFILLMGMISLGIFIGGVLLVFIFNFIIMRPIKKILDASSKIASGEYSKRVEYLGHNSFGELSNTFNSLARDIEKLNEQNENLSRQLKVLFRDKIGELNLEINQRRLAEFSLKQSEQEFRALFEQAPIGMVLLSTDKKIIKINQAFSSTLGYEEDEIFNSSITIISHPIDKESDLEKYQQLLNGEVSSLNHEKRFIKKNKEIIFAVVQVALIYDENDKPLHLIEQIIDITPRKLAEQELIASKEKAEESDRLKTAFLAQMSHEIRTPLNIILNATPLIADELNDTADSDTEVLLDSVNSAGKRLQRTIDMILNMSSVQTGNYHPDFEEFDLQCELKKLVEEFKRITADKKLDLSINTSEKNINIYADKYTVIQIFQNLIHNAIKYTLKGKVEIFTSNNESGDVIVEVKDSGIGMAQEYLAKLFLPFSQEDVGHKREFEGNGLGLALVKKYIELNNAEISVKSVKGRGSAFTVVFLKSNKILS